MTSHQQPAALQRQIWVIANDVRGSVDGWDFKQGEFFTLQHVSKLIAQLAMHKQTSVNKIYDPACGSGSLLLQAKKHFDAHMIEEGFFGQKINHTTYNLARMNMFLRNINYDKFNMQLGNTLTGSHFLDDKPFDATVSKAKINRLRKDIDAIVAEIEGEGLGA